MVATIWSAPGCVWCNKAKDLLTKESIPYVEKIVGVNATRQELLEAVPNTRSVPQIFVDGRYIGGYNDLNVYLHPELAKT